jgi:hypothetical protein
VGQAVGAILVLAVLQDVFFTVLFPASGHGLLRRPLARWTWAGFRSLGRRLARARRRQFLAYSGPVQITVNLGAWILLLILGWALIFQPALGMQITASSGPTDRSLATALYYSGFVLTTLGVGDIVARDGLYRLLTVIEAGIGFATVTMAITYFLSVYSALTQRKVSAAQLHHRTYGTGDAAALLAGLARDGQLPGAVDELDSMAQFLQRALETHASYPVLRYFHQRHVYYALPRVLLVSFETVTLLEVALDPHRYGHVIGSPAAAALRAAARQLLAELVPHSTARRPTRCEQQCWGRRCGQATDQLAAAGLRMRADQDQVAADYVGARAEWDQPLRSLAFAMVYDWRDIDPQTAGPQPDPPPR